MTGEEAAAAPRALETHISVLFFLGDRVYKLRKPVTYAFLDFSSREARELDCHREVELNRRYAPDVYLGVYDITAGGEPVDHLVVMRRLPEERSLARLVEEKTLRPDDLTAVVRTFLACEADAPRSGEIDAQARREVLYALWRANSLEMAGFLGTIIDAADDARVLELAENYLEGRERLLEARISQGRVRDGHGDLMATDIFCLDDGPRILDCIEFDDSLRSADVLADIGLLAMDLEHLGAKELSSFVFESYASLAGDRFPPSLAAYYCAARAYMRAKVSCLAAADGTAGAAEEARALHLLARSFLERARVQLVLIGGLPGTGKSTLAAAAGKASGASVLRSDEIRRQLSAAGSPTTAASYDEATTEATYARMLELARAELELGVSVILDASWSAARHRAAARELAAGTHSRLLELRCEAPTALAEHRIGERRRLGRDASEATVAVARTMARQADPWPGSIPIDTGVPLPESLQAVLAALGGAPVPQPSARDAVLRGSPPAT